MVQISQFIPDLLIKLKSEFRNRQNDSNFERQFGINLKPNHTQGGALLENFLLIFCTLFHFFNE